MSDTSPILSMPYIQPAQAQKHVTHNDALSLLDSIVQLVVLSADQSAPPSTAVDGDRYVVAANGQGDWAGQSGNIAVFLDASWRFIAPLAGWSAYARDINTNVVFDGAVWAGQQPELNNLPGLGIGTSFDGYNKLAVSSDAVLLNHAGGGHQLKVNKSGQGDTASLLFQTGYGGRAEMGTAGSDDFTLKVSADGSSWVEALRVDAASGRIQTAVAGWREILTAPRSYYVDQSLGNDGNDGLSAGAGAFASIAKGVEAAMSIDTGGHDITLKLADGTYSLVQPVEVDCALTGGGWLVIEGNTGTPDLVVIDAPDQAFIIAKGDVSLYGLRLQNSSSVDATVSASGNSHLTLDSVNFGDAGGHVALRGARLTLGGVCGIDGDAGYHLHLSDGARFEGNGQTVTLTGTPDFVDAFCVCSHTSIARFAGQSFAGSATGTRYDLSANAVIDSGAVVLPGDVAGTTQTGAVYV
ncbi:Protein of unknown function [Sulfitobacter marinus]|uniref:DUF2793 domain-containing protein n=1 Tax=Sulfitobacter marinus TaxID=394264 RepID=A0A1I6T9E1_9RHOB|nr:DUF2793 domain-containing protein [Sulfitobacter marinus]SFS85810.1 Protein of unknown function [Sulfitobacter marinus]